MPITTNVVSSKLAHDEVYSIQNFVIKFASDLRQVNGLLRVLWFPPPIKLTATIYPVTETLLKVALSTITLKPLKFNLKISIVLKQILAQGKNITPKS